MRADTDMGLGGPGGQLAAGYTPADAMSPIDAQQLDPRWIELVEALAPRALGREDRRGAALAAEVARLSDVYTRERHALALAADARAARLRFFFLRDLPKIQGPLAELAAAGALPAKPTWRVLDVGAGLGTSSLGAAELARRAGAARLEVVALERDAAALDLFEQLARRAAAEGLSVPIELEPHRASLEEIELARLPRFDLVLVGLTLNELHADRDEAECLDAHERLVRELAERLDEGGSLVLLEPATRVITRRLMELRDRFARDPSVHVFAPCVREGPCPLLDRERDWCHDQLPFALPDELGALAEDAGLRRERLTYSHLTLRRDRRRLSDVAGGDPRAQRIVAGPVRTKGKIEWEACGGQGLVKLRRLDRERTASSAALDGAGRGTLVRLDRDVRDGEALRIRPDVLVERLLR